MLIQKKQAWKPQNAHLMQGEQKLLTFPLGVQNKLDPLRMGRRSQQVFKETEQAVLVLYLGPVSWSKRQD